MSEYENMSREQLMAALEASKKASQKNITLKVSEKKCVQLNGLRKFPIVLYKKEWETIFAMREQIEAFIAEHENELATK